MNREGNVSPTVPVAPRCGEPEGPDGAAWSQRTRKRRGDTLAGGVPRTLCVPSACQRPRDPPAEHDGPEVAPHSGTRVFCTSAATAFYRAPRRQPESAPKLEPDLAKEWRQRNEDQKYPCPPPFGSIPLPTIPPPPSRAPHGPAPRGFFRSAAVCGAPAAARCPQGTPRFPTGAREVPGPLRLVLGGHSRAPWVAAQACITWPPSMLRVWPVMFCA